MKISTRLLSVSVWSLENYNADARRSKNMLTETSCALSLASTIPRNAGGRFLGATQKVVMEKLAPRPS